jgi:hypothetical protein
MPRLCRALDSTTEVVGAVAEYAATSFYWLFSWPRACVALALAPNAVTVDVIAAVVPHRRLVAEARNREQNAAEHRRLI